MKNKLTFGQKLLFGLFGVQFASAFTKERQRLNEKPRLSELQQEYVVNSILESETYQNLISKGKTPKQITEILGINKMNKERFELLTNKPWPL
jgi:dihydroorotate dehydrogenase